ncbi:glycosyltransferase family 2 protein [Sphingomonas sp. PL20]|uniref:glycosyltransferase family 2 protein n=1 Tax=Sphingomonas sp. PL20 TaxID=2760712 RepID=UPI001AE1F46C
MKLWLEHVARQSLMPNAMIWAVHSDDDLPSGEWRSRPNSPIVCKSDPGLTKQRNAALRIVPPETNIVAFFDDDYIPSSYCIEGIVNVFKLYPLAIGITGVILADGIKTVGIGVGEAMNIIAERDKMGWAKSPRLVRQEGLYGCNMAYRFHSLARETFDENLPLYGWQEDVDFANRAARYGIIGATDGFGGVHRGSKSGRSSGRRIGYSQISNPIYLWNKRTMSTALAVRLMFGNIVANHARMIMPEPWVDRKGRVVGNWIAIVDLILGRLDPTRVVDL